MRFKGVIPVAEFETRFLPTAKAQPEEMLPITENLVIQHAVEDSIDTEIMDNILLTVGKEKRVLEDVLREKGKETVLGVHFGIYEKFNRKIKFMKK